MSGVSSFVTQCRSCRYEGLETVIDLGVTALSDRLLSTARRDEHELTAPLQLSFCPNCSLAQLRHTVSPSLLFDESYPYYSSVSPGLLSHFQQSGRDLIGKLGLSGSSQVVEIASNDGYLLKVFRDAGIPVLGIDPSLGPARAAQGDGIDTITEFFGEKLASTLRSEQDLQADLILANNVLAHVPEILQFVRGIEILLKPDGRVVIEAPYLLDLVDHTEFDTIYHQHVFYYSVQALVHLFGTCGLHINSIEPLTVHGGSLRLSISRSAVEDGTVAGYVRRENRRRITSTGFYASFVGRVEKLRADLMRTLRELRSAGARIAGFGAAAKGNTLMAYCGIDSTILDYLVDSNPRKHGLYMSGNRLPIHSPAMLESQPPDYLLILAWNLADEIMRQEAAFASAGGRFIIPVPELLIV